MSLPIDFKHGTDLLSGQVASDNPPPPPAVPQKNDSVPLSGIKYSA